MKKNNLVGWLLICNSLFFLSCNTTTPEKYFDIAVLNSNMLFGFANDALVREFESPSVMMVSGSDEPVPMKRSNIIGDKIEYIETSLKKIKGLQETKETKDILKDGIALYEFVLPVYKNEYVQLAALYDAGAAPEKIHAYAKSIGDKYYLQYEMLYNKLIGSGQLYAEKNGIKVTMVNPSPH